MLQHQLTGGWPPPSRHSRARLTRDQFFAPLASEHVTMCLGRPSLRCDATTTRICTGRVDVGGHLRLHHRIRIEPPIVSGKPASRACDGIPRS
jgi:hypothetical protein